MTAKWTRSPDIFAEKGVVVFYLLKQYTSKIVNINVFAKKYYQGSIFL